MAEDELKTEQTVKRHRRSAAFAIAGVLVVLAVIGGGTYWYVSSKTVYIDQSVIQAPVINLSPTDSGFSAGRFCECRR